METRKLPTISDLYKNSELAIIGRQLQILLNQQPAKEWIKIHPIYKNEYIPIEVQEWLLTSIFSKWWVEVKSVQQMLNSAVVCVRLYVQDPTTDEIIYQDGLGAHNFQLKSGAKADDFSHLQQNAVMLAVPIAESRAFSDAADKFGKIFGKDLNRKNGMNYDKLVDKFQKPELIPNTDVWDEAVKGLKAKNVTIEAIKKSFTITNENINLLLNESVQS